MAGDTQTDLTEPLTSRESEVLDLLRVGLTNREIARRLDISPAGARYHVSEIIGKLGVRNRYEAAVWPKRPPWWLPAATPVLLLWQQAKALVPVKLSSVALAASGVVIAAALGGIALIVFLSLGGANGSGEPSSQASCPSRGPLSQDDGGDITVDELTDHISRNPSSIQPFAGGANPIFEITDANGNRFIFKQLPDDDVASTEAASAALFSALGAKAPAARAVSMPSMK